jgi:hypothetical protein
MKKSFVVKEVCKTSDSKRLHVKIEVDGEEKGFDIVFEGIGATFPGELQHILMSHLSHMKEFGKLVFDCYEGVPREFPIQFECWELPPDFDPTVRRLLL